MSIDDTDDWMNPSRGVVYKSPPPKNGTYFVIERKKATPVTGNVSHIYSWDRWDEFKSKEERDAELKRLREEHPMWHLRGRTYTYLHGRRIGSADPFEYRDD